MNRGILTSYFPIYIPLISFGFLIALARTSSTVVSRYEHNEQPCVVPHFSKIALSFSSFNLMLATGLLYIAFVMFMYAACTPEIFKTYNMKASWIFSKCF